ncbi:MAG: DNA polymerase I [Lachnospiraceae bacterium]
MEKVVLIDGLSILNRAYYGVPPLTNSEGIHTNAVHGFLNIMFKILEEEQPTYLAVAFDVKAKTFRHELYEAYKGTRKGMPDELREQVPLIKDVLCAMNICVYEQAGFEADDILGTLAKKAEKEGKEVSLVSGDRDLLQIASEHIKIRIPKTRMGKTEIEDYYEKDVVDKYGVTPLGFIDLKALMGDTADNIPGVPRVGEKTATALMLAYGSIEGIYEHVEEVSKKSIKESLIANRDLADLSKVLATIKIDCDIDFDYKNGCASDYFTKEAYEICKRLELKMMLKKFDDTVITETNHNEEIVKQFEVCSDFMQAEVIFEQMQLKAVVGLYVLQEEGVLYALALSADNKTVCILPEGFLTQSYLEEKVKDLSSKTKVVVCHIKNYYHMLNQESLDHYFDLVIGAYLIHPLKNDYDVVAIANEYLGMTIATYKELFAKREIASVMMLELDKLCEFVNYQAYVTAHAYEVIQQKLIEMNMHTLMMEMEMPLSYTLYCMEQAGVKVEKQQLKEYGEMLQTHITTLQASIWERAGVEFNINSPKQLGEILFETLAIPGGKKTKTGYSTAADVLEKLAVEYPIVAEVLEYRGYSKLKSTYADGLSAYILEDGRIHTKFQQTVTATGRLSSTEPNLQNIPMRTELGRQVRKVFVPQEGYAFMDADYSQIELRILAHIADDKQLIEAYAMDEDIHRITASKVFHTPFEEVTDLQRRNAKAVNFGIVYGISSFGLSQDLSITTKEAKQYIDQYFATYPEVKRFLEDIVASTKEKGYVETLYNRKRPVPELKSSNFMQRSFGERIAMNSPIQGSAADIMKVAMIRVHRALIEGGYKSRLILQVHDELVIETALDEVEAVRELLYKNMKEAAQLAVSLEVDLHVGKTWYDAK